MASKWIEAGGLPTRRHGQFVRLFAGKSVFDADSFEYVWKARGNVRDAAGLFNADWDAALLRARCGRGWKNHKCRHQWEHGARLREKHEASRSRKAWRCGEWMQD